MNFISKITKDEQNVWNLIFGALFAALLLGAIAVLERENAPYYYIPVWDAALIALAIFRLIRLTSYDKITQFARDIFYDFDEAPDGTLIRVKAPRGPRRTVTELLDCPWCTGVWIALFVVFFYFYTPYARFVVIMLAVAGVASFIQITANAIGWTAERKKQKVLAKE